MTNQPQDGDVIEFFTNNHGLLVGNTDSIPPVRRVARINYVKGDGSFVAYDADGIRCVLSPGCEMTVLVPDAEVTAGWDSL